MSENNTTDVGDILSLPDGCVDAMESAMSMCEAIHDNGLCINDLTRACRLIVEEGHDMMVIQLMMMTRAVSVAGRSNRSDHEHEAG